MHWFVLTEAVLHLMQPISFSLMYTLISYRFSLLNGKAIKCAKTYKSVIQEAWWQECPGQEPGETSWQLGLSAMGPSPWMGWREGEEDATAPVPSCPVRAWRAFLFFLRRKIIENYWILCLEQGNKIFPLKAVQIWHPRNHTDTNQGTLQPSVWKKTCRLNVKLEKNYKGELPI